MMLLKERENEKQRSGVEGVGPRTKQGASMHLRRMLG